MKIVGVHDGCSDARAPGLHAVTSSAMVSRWRLGEFFSEIQRRTRIAGFYPLATAKQKAMPDVATEPFAFVRDNNTGQYERYDRERGDWIKGQENR